MVTLVVDATGSSEFADHGARAKLATLARWRSARDSGRALEIVGRLAGEAGSSELFDFR